MSLLNLTDSDGNGKISAMEFTRARDPKTGSLEGLSPNFGDEGISLICNDPALIERLTKIEKSRFDLINSNKPLTGRDLIESNEETIKLYRDLAEGLENGKFSRLNGAQITEAQKKTLSRDFKQMAYDVEDDNYKTMRGDKNTDANAYANTMQTSFREKFRSFPGGVEFGSINDCLVGQSPDIGPQKLQLANTQLPKPQFTL
jgi:hypothetical protein